jgi:hypothetical protein
MRDKLPTYRVNQLVNQYLAYIGINYDRSARQIGLTLSVLYVKIEEPHKKEAHQQ